MLRPCTANDAGEQPDELVLPRRRKGEDRRQQHDGRFDAVAPGLDRHGEAVRRAAQHLAGHRDIGIGQRDERGADRGQLVGPGHHEVLLRPGRQLGAEEHGQQDEEEDEEADHPAILPKPARPGAERRADDGCGRGPKALPSLIRIIIITLHPIYRRFDEAPGPVPPPGLLLLFCGAAAAADTEFTLVIQDHRFQPTEITVPAGQKIKLTVENRDATPEEFESKSLKREKVIAGKSSATIMIGPLDRRAATPSSASTTKRPRRASSSPSRRQHRDVRHRHHRLSRGARGLAARRHRRRRDALRSGAQSLAGRRNLAGLAGSALVALAPNGSPRWRAASARNCSTPQSSASPS